MNGKELRVSADQSVKSPFTWGAGFSNATTDILRPKSIRVRVDKGHVLPLCKPNPGGQKTDFLPLSSAASDSEDQLEDFLPLSSTTSQARVFIERDLQSVSIELGNELILDGNATKTAEKKPLFVEKGLSSTTTNKEEYPEISIGDNEIDLFSNMLKYDEFETGMISDSEDYLRGLMKRTSKDYGMKLILYVYERNADDGQILSGILHILSHFTFDEARPYGLPIAMWCLGNKDPVIKESTIHVFDSWNNKAYLKALRNFDSGSIWIGRIVKELIKRIEENGE